MSRIMKTKKTNKKKRREEKVGVVIKDKKGNDREGEAVE